MQSFKGKYLIHNLISSLEKNYRKFVCAYNYVEGKKWLFLSVSINGLAFIRVLGESVPSILIFGRRCYIAKF